MAKKPHGANRWAASWQQQILATNRKARHNYSILEAFEAGVVLLGTEVKSLREGHASLADAFATVDDGEVWLRNLHIPEYQHGSWTNHEPRRNRKLLLHRRQIDALIGKIAMVTSRWCRCRCTSPKEKSKSSSHWRAASRPTTNVRTWHAATPSAKWFANWVGEPRA